MKNLTRFTSILSTTLLPAFAWADFDFSDVRFGGFFSNGYLESSHYNYPADTEDGTFEFAEMGLNASWTPKDRLTVNGQLFAFELGPYGNYEPMVDYLFLDYNVRRAFGVRAGRVKRESGIYTHVQDIDLSRTSILLPMGIYDQRFRDISAALDGVSLYGNLDLWENAYLDYNVYSGFIELEPDGGVGGLTLTSISRFAEDAAIGRIESDKIHGAQFWLSPGLDGLRAGAGWYRIPDITASISGRIFPTNPNPFFAGQNFESTLTGYTMDTTILSLEYFVGDWNFLGEYVTTETCYDSVSTVAGMMLPPSSSSSDSSSWYVSASRRLGRVEAAVTYTENGGGASSDGSGRFRGMEDLQFSLRFDATDFWTLKAEIHSIRGTDRLFNEHYQNQILDEESWTLFAAKSTFFF